MQSDGRPRKDGIADKVRLALRYISLLAFNQQIPFAYPM